jgi:tetratricopeptide (TPR) repeat protein
LALVVSLAACGGSQDGPPGPLTMHFDDMYIAAIPLDQKQAVVQSQNDWNLARMENAKAEADFNESTTQLSVVHNDQKATKLAVDSALSNKKAADASADTNRVSQATKDLHTAEDLAKAADERVKYIDVYRDYLRLVQRYAQENMYWREAQYELAKSKLGRSNNIAPKGVEFDTFPKQEADRGRRTGSAKSRVESGRERAQGARENWRRAQETADRENGHNTNFPDPMAKSASR